MIEAGSKIGNYKVVRLLGEGGMGRVFEAVHDQIGRRAAIKVLHAQFAHNSEAYTRFLNEARAVNIIQHPGLVNVFEFGQTEDGSPYIVMEFLEGETLADRLTSVGRMSLGALRIARQIASALMAAHAKHIVHRDLKPANVMLVPDPDMPGGERVKVVDFGIAKISAEHNDTGYKTRAGAILGTPTYMSPEQCRGAGEVTEKTDVYALGVMIYEMLVGRPPFVAEGGGEIMGMHLFQVPPALHMLEPTLPLELVDLVHSMLSKDPDARPSIVQVAHELDRIGGHLTGSMQAVSAEVAAMATEPKPPGPLTIPIDLRRQAQVTSVSHAQVTPPSASSQPGAASSRTPAQPFVPVHPLAAPITPSHYTPTPLVSPYSTPTPYTPYITPSHYGPPYVTPPHYTPAPVTPSGLTPPPLAPPPAMPSGLTPPLAPPPAVPPEPAGPAHAAEPRAPGVTQILSSGSTPVTRPEAVATPSQSAMTPVTRPEAAATPSQSATTPVTRHDTGNTASQSAKTPIRHTPPTEPPSVHAPVTPAPAAGSLEPSTPAADHAKAPPEALRSAEPETETLVGADTSSSPASPSRLPARESGESTAAEPASPSPSAAVVQPLAASDSGPIKASPHAPTIGVSQPGTEPSATPQQAAPAADSSLAPHPASSGASASASEERPATPVEEQKPAIPPEVTDRPASLSPSSTAVVASAGSVQPPAPVESDDKRSLKIVLLGLSAAAVILVVGVIVGLYLRSRNAQPTPSEAEQDAATFAPIPSKALPEPVPQPGSEGGIRPLLPGPASAPADLGSSGPELAAPKSPPTDAAAVDAGTSESDAKPKKKKPLLRRKKGLRNEEIEYLD